MVKVGLIKGASLPGLDVKDDFHFFFLRVRGDSESTRVQSVTDINCTGMSRASGSYHILMGTGVMSHTRTSRAVTVMHRT